MPRGIRVTSKSNSFSGGLDVYGDMMPGFQPVPSALVGKGLSDRLMDLLSS
jgi:hypothetical protein